MSRKVRVDEEDDLDDLDDVLDKFSSQPPPSQQKSAPPPPPPTAATQRADETNEDDLTSDFARELARGMESLMRELGAPSGQGIDFGLGEGGTDGGGSGNKSAGNDGDMSKEEEEERERAFRAAWEAMLVEGMDGMSGEGGLDGPFKGNALGADKKEQSSDQKKGSTSGPQDQDDFQRTIRAAMDKLKESESSLKADSAESASSDPLEALLSQLGESGSGDELQGMVESIMTQLVSKDVLYEPMKELSDKFPSYLSEHAGTLSADDKKRFEEQMRVSKEMIVVFDDPAYSDENTGMLKKILELMTEMQSYGSPPSEIMGPLPPGFDMGNDGLPQLPEGCTIA